jgi:hypothetical protein
MGQKRTFAAYLLACFSEVRATSPSTDHVCTHTIRVHSRRTIQVHSHTCTRRTIRAHTDTRRTLHHGNGRTGGSVATAASALAPLGPVVMPSPVLRDRKQPRQWRKSMAAMQARPKLPREPIRFSFGPPKLTTLVYQEAWKREAGSKKFHGNSKPHARSSKIASHPSISPRRQPSCLLCP